MSLNIFVKFRGAWGHKLSRIAQIEIYRIIPQRNAEGESYMCENGLFRSKIDVKRELELKAVAIDLLSALNEAKASSLVVKQLSLDALMVLLKSETDRFKRQTQEMDEQKHQLMILRHDLKNHLICMDALIGSGKTEEIKTYIQDLLKSNSAPHNGAISALNPVLEALVADKAARASEKNIEIKQDFRITKTLNVKPADWVSLVGNALDNAIEACEKNTAENRWIELVAVLKGTMLSVRISNPSQVEPLKNDGEFITQKDTTANDHGLGLKSIKRVVERYNGVMEADFSQGFFDLYFALYEV